MSTIKYTPEHEWARIEGDAVVVGLTNFARRAIG